MDAHPILVNLLLLFRFVINSELFIQRTTQFIIAIGLSTLESNNKVDLFPAMSWTTHNLTNIDWVKKAIEITTKILAFVNLAYQNLHTLLSFRKFVGIFNGKEVFFCRSRGSSK